MKTKKELFKDYVKKGYDIEKQQGFCIEGYISLIFLLSLAVISCFYFKNTITISITSILCVLIILVIICDGAMFYDYCKNISLNNIKDILENEKNNINKLRQLIKSYKEEESIFEKKDLYNEIQNMINVRDVIENEKIIFKILKDFEKNINYTLKTIDDLDKYLNKHNTPVEAKECICLEISGTIEKMLSENNVNLIDDTYILLYKPNLLEKTDLKLYDNFYNIYQKNNIKRIEQKNGETKCEI